MKKILVAILVLIFFLNVNTANGWFGAGKTSGWPHAYNGASSEVINSYDTPPQSYKANSSVAISFRIENPIENTNFISDDLFLKIWKVENVNPNEDFSEEILNKNHQENNDIQSPYKTIDLGQLNLSPGESTQFDVEFEIEDAGYYQFDLTDLSENEDFIPGHIYSAGFLRVIENSSVQSVQSNRKTDTTFVIPSLALLAILTLLLLIRKFRKQIAILLKKII